MDIESEERSSYCHAQGYNEAERRPNDLTFAWVLIAEYVLATRSGQDNILMTRGKAMVWTV